MQEDNIREGNGIENRSRAAEVRAFTAGLAHIVAVIIVVLLSPTGRALFDGMSTGSMQENLLDVSCDLYTPNVDFAALVAFMLLLIPGLLVLLLIQSTLPSIPLQSALASITVIAISAGVFTLYGGLTSNKKGCIAALILALIHSGVALVIAFFGGFVAAITCAG